MQRDNYHNYSYTNTFIIVYTVTLTLFIELKFLSPPVSYLHAGCELGIDALESMTDYYIGNEKNGVGMAK